MPLNKKAISIISVSPNPFTDRMTLKATMAQPSVAIVNILDARGKVVFEKNVDAREGINTIMLEGLDFLSKTFYTLRVKIKNEMQLQKLVKSTE